MHTSGSGYPMEIKNGHLLVEHHHYVRVYDWNDEGETPELRAREVYGYGTYDDDKQETDYTYVEIIWQPPVYITEGEKRKEKKLKEKRYLLQEDIDFFADEIDFKEHFDESKAKEFYDQYGYTYGAEITFYKNTEEEWLKLRTSQEES